jgi:hypothetical protein
MDEVAGNKEEITPRLQHVSRLKRRQWHWRKPPGQGVYKLDAQRMLGKIDKRTKQFKAIKQIENKIIADHRESARLWHARNAAILQHYCKVLDSHLLSIKHVVRRGKINPGVDLRLRFSDAIDKTLASLDAYSDQQIDLATKYKLGLMK